jgi:ribosomal protein S18 acetylase RimI-like enzyme
MFPDDITLRNFSPQDLESVSEFKKKSVVISFPDAEYDIKTFRKNIISASEKEPDSVRVLEKNGKVVGYIWFRIRSGITGTMGIVNHVFIDESVRRMGLANDLMNAAEDFFRSRGIKKARVTVTLSNESSLRMCKKLGYKEKRVIMEKDL